MKILSLWARHYATIWLMVCPPLASLEATRQRQATCCQSCPFPSDVRHFVYRPRPNSCLKAYPFIFYLARFLFFLFLFLSLFLLCFSFVSLSFLFWFSLFLVCSTPLLFSFALLFCSSLLLFSFAFLFPLSLSFFSFLLSYQFVS